MLKRCAILPFFLLLTACTGESGKTNPGDHIYRAEVFDAKWMAGMQDPVSNAFLLVGEQGSILRSENGYDWVYADTPVTQRLNQIGADSKSGVLVAVGDGGTLLRSEDAGLTWRQPPIELPKGVTLDATELTAVIHHPASNAWIAVGSQNAILRSTDDARNWRLTSYVSTPDQVKILALYVEPETGDLLFGAQYGTLGRSSDGGATWNIGQHKMDAPPSYIPHIVGFHRFEDTLIAAADLGRLLISRDGGRNWQLHKLPTTAYVTDGEYDPMHHSIVLTTQKGEIAHSADGGRHWSLERLRVKDWPDEETPRLSAVRYDNKTRELLVMGNSGVVGRSFDGGRTWRSGLIKSLFNMSLTTLLHDAQRDLFVAAGLGGFILSSKGLKVDPAAGWDVVRPGIDLYLRKVINIPGSNTFLAAGQLGGILRSEDDGRSWTLVEADYPYPNHPPYYFDMIIDPQSGALVAAGPDGSIMRSVDNGNTWTSVFQGDINIGEAFTRILVDHKHNALVVPEVEYGSVYISENGGANWSKAAKLPAKSLWHGAVSRKTGVIVLAGKDGTIVRSEDGGRTWSAIYTMLEGNFYGVYAAADGTFFAVGEKGRIMRSIDGGQHWQTMRTTTASTLRRMVTDPKTGVLLAFGQDGVILRSEDDGLHWISVPNPATEELREALIEPGSDSLLIIGRKGAILRSIDGGKTWEALPSHTTQHFRSAGINPATGTLIAVGDGLVRLSHQ